MKAKRLLVLAMSAVMLSTSTVPAWAASSAITGSWAQQKAIEDVVFKGVEAWKDIVIPWGEDVDILQIDTVEFPTKGGAATDWKSFYHGLLIKNLYAPNATDTVKVTVTFKDGTKWERTLTFADEADAVTPETPTDAVNINKDAAYDWTSDVSIPNVDTIGAVYIDDLEIEKATVSKSGGYLKLSRSAYKGIVPGDYTLTVYNTDGYGEYHTIHINNTVSNTYPWVSPSMVRGVKGGTDEPVVVISVGTGDHIAGGVKAVGSADGINLESADWEINADRSLVIKQSGLAKLPVGVSRMNVVFDNNESGSFALYVTRNENPVVTPKSVTYNKQYPTPVTFDLDMGKYEFSKVKINNVEIDQFMLNGTSLTIQDTYTKTLAVGTYKVSVLARTGETFDVAALEVVDIKKNEPQMGEIQNKTLGIDAPWVFPANTMDYTFKSLKIDGNVVAGATYNAEKGQIAVPAEDFNAIGEKEVTLSVATNEGQDFVLGTVKPAYVTKGMAETIAVNPTKYTYNVDSGKALDIAASKSWDNVIWEGRSKDGKKYYSGYAANVSDGKIPFNDEKMKPEAGSELAVIVFDSKNPGQSNPFYVSVVSTGAEGEEPGTPVTKVHSITPAAVTYDKRDKRDVKFSCDAAVKSYVLQGTINGTVVLRTGTCTEATIPEAVLQGLDNGMYTVKFMCTDDVETNSATVTITRSGAVSGATDTVDNSNWSYPGKTLPNRNNALGGGKTSGGSSGSSGSSSSGTSSSSSSSSQTVTYPSIDLSLLSLLVTDFNGWEKQSDGRWRFKDASGNYRASTYLVLSSGSYVIGSDGYMVTGWIVNPNNGQWFYADKTNGDLRDGWQLVDGVWYYLAGRDDATHTWGQMYANERTPDGYTVNASGAWVQ